MKAEVASFLTGRVIPLFVQLKVDWPVADSRFREALLGNETSASTSVPGQQGQKCIANDSLTHYVRPRHYLERQRRPVGQN